MALSEAVLMASKFRGCLVGSLLGDCLGAPFEGDPPVTKIVLQNYFDKLYGPYFNAPVKQYTDDTAMTKCVAESLLKQGGFDAVDMSKRFVKEYFQQPRRGYGANVTHVFAKLRATQFSDVYAPAKEQFGGMGSYGNGGAMRVSPISLFYHSHSNSHQIMCEVARQASEITHANRDACNGAILQCIAVDQSLRLDPREPLDNNAFLDGLCAKLKHIEKDEEGLGLQDTSPYQDALKTAKEFLSMPSVFDAQVDEALGTDISALRSVPTAIFCFLKAQQTTPLEGILTPDPMRRTLQYAISLGGDTDTIASMAGALAGAYLGSDAINKSVMKHCETSEEMSKLGDKLYKSSTS